ncbi:MAG: CaiB/BaiF CoA transferase family protein [Gammaproteobacteria bacterium]
MTAQTGPLLNGVRILDFTRALAGPTCTRLFAEMGAEVIKVEAAPGGDMTRGISKLRNERSLYFVQQNLNKKSLCLDLKKPEGLAIVRELVPRCDVVVENFRPGVMNGLGLGFEALRALREDIILCSISAFGQRGPLADKPGYDTIAQAYSGVTSMIGEPDQAPYIPGLALGDVGTGVHAAFGVAAALFQRERSGRGQHLDIALLDCYYHCFEVAVHQASGSNGALKPTRGGRHFGYICPAGVFRAAGGELVLMACLHHWPDLCRAMSREDLIDHPEWATDAARLARKAAVIALVEDWLATFPDVAHAIAHLDGHDVPCAPVLSIEETLHHPHFLERGTVRTVEDRLAGKFAIPGMPIKLAGGAVDMGYAAPLLGEHNQEVLCGLLGRSEDEVAALRDAGVLHAAAI